jgi:hypothetical protein
MNKDVILRLFEGGLVHNLTVEKINLIDDFELKQLLIEFKYAYTIFETASVHLKQYLTKEE